MNADMRYKARLCESRLLAHSGRGGASSRNLAITCFLISVELGGVHTYCIDLLFSLSNFLLLLKAIHLVAFRERVIKVQKMIGRRSAAGLSGSRLDESYQSYPLMYWPREERTWFPLQFKFGLALQHDLQCTISVANLSERGQISFLALALTVPLG